MEGNRGFQPREYTAADWQLGGVSGLKRTILQPDRNWRPSLPALEIQRTPEYDTMACVTFSAWNGVEALAFKKYGIRLNKSDRFTAKMSGTTANGNNFWDVAQSIAKLHGFVDEEKWPFKDCKTFQIFYADVPQMVVELGLKSLDGEFKINYEAVWDTPESLYDALQYAPIQVGIYAYGQFVNGVYQRSENRGNHAVLLFNAVEGEYWEIYDHYENAFKKLAWNTRFWGAYAYDITKKPVNPPMPPSTYKFVENTRYFVNVKPGATLFYLGGMLRFDDLAKCNDQWLGRISEGDGILKGKSKTISSANDLVGVHVFDLRGNDLGLATDVLKIQV